MITRSLKIIALAVLLQVSSCTPEMTDDPIPFKVFNDLTVNLNLPEYAALRTDGGYKTFDDIGVRGVIVYRVNATTLRAFERTCSFQPNQAGSTIDVHSSGLFLIDASCGSSFNFADGSASGGPAWRPLLQYRIEVTGSLLIITDDVIN
jgi:hypothetical protein